MLPQISDKPPAVLQTAEPPSDTWIINSDGDAFSGLDCERLAMAQAIYLLLSVERYQHGIYSRDYGAELRDLFGKPHDYAASEGKRRITEALLRDSRIRGVDNFSFARDKNKLLIRFTADTIFGEINAEREVQL